MSTSFFLRRVKRGMSRPHMMNSRPTSVKPKNPMKPMAAATMAMVNSTMGSMSSQGSSGGMGGLMGTPLTWTVTSS